MNKLELPKDIGEKVLAMLKPNPRPACVLIFEPEEEMITWKATQLSAEDRDFLLENNQDQHWGLYEVEHAFQCSNNKVHRALMLGFYFKDEAARKRWKTGKDFELYRDAVHAIA
jgi:hypothetical protein